MNDSLTDKKMGYLNTEHPSRRPGGGYCPLCADVASRGGGRF